MPRNIAPVPPLEERRRPGLSLTLKFPRRLDTCQSCGVITNELTEPHEKWREHNEWDKPTEVLVVLCAGCSKRPINPHPRVYAFVDKWAPEPGAMALCVGCLFNDSLLCRSPLRKANGGPGLEVRFPQPDVAHVNYGGGRGEFKKFYKGPPTVCVGRTE